MYTSQCTGNEVTRNKSKIKTLQSSIVSLDCGMYFPAVLSDFITEISLRQVMMFGRSYQINYNLNEVLQARRKSREILTLDCS